MGLHVGGWGGIEYSEQTMVGADILSRRTLIYIVQRLTLRNTSYWWYSIGLGNCALLRKLLYDRLLRFVLPEKMSN